MNAQKQTSYNLNGVGCSVGPDITDKVHEIHGAMEELKHLSMLPAIVQNLEQLNKTVLDAAIGRSQVPQKLFLISLGTAALIIVVLIAKDGTKTFSLDSNGMRYGQESTAP